MVFSFHLFTPSYLTECKHCLAVFIDSTETELDLDSEKLFSARA